MSALAHQLVLRAGTADRTDADLVAAELALMPEPVLEAFRAAGVRVKACRGSVVDHRRDLNGVRPRGWPEGATWNAVPGAFLPDEHCVVIATQGGADGRRYIPPQGESHGSWNLVLHESFHADDYLGDRARCCNAAFLTARDADFARLGDYERQEGAAGLEESYAESAARHFGGDPDLLDAWPALAAFWRAAQLPIAPARVRDRRRSAGEMGAAIGTADVEANGTIRLDLRAETDGGAVGHALITVAPRTANYEIILSHLQAGRRGSATRLVTPFD